MILVLWKQEVGTITIKDGNHIKTQFNVLLHPKEWVITKIEAHTKKTDSAQDGNVSVNYSARWAALKYI